MGSTVVRATRDFYPRPPRGGRLVPVVSVVDEEGFLSTPSARRATHLLQFRKQELEISIHALREEGDLMDIEPPTLMIGISIHALREEGDLCKYRAFLLFIYFYPRPPRGGRQVHLKSTIYPLRISIHALREEGDYQPYG